MALHEATADELAGWDARTVQVPGGNVFQSRTWADQRARHGWQPRFLVFDDGFCVLAAERPWRVVPGAGVYIARGPVSAGEPAERTAARLHAVASWLFERGVDAVSSDSEIPADTGYPELLRERGFRAIDEVQPSRHRVALTLGTDADAGAVFAAFSTATRQRIRSAERHGVRIVRHDTRAAATAEGGTTSEADAAVEGLYELLLSTAGRRHFPPPPRAAFVDLATHALAAGLAVLLEARTPDGRLLGSAMFYRHGGRLTYANSGDRTELRHEFPGVVHLLVWRAIQIAIMEGMDEMDLAGVDVAGARRRPAPDDELYGLLTFKESFGGRWIELSGNHERVARPWRYLAARVVGRLARSAGRQALA